MSLDILLGLQWGDEGKGKIVDLLAPRYQIVARFQGGPNAGHTIYVNGQKHVLHTIPSGIVHNDVDNVIGSGMVIDPVVLKGEIEALKAEGLFNADRLLIAKNAHLITPTHRALDKAQELAKHNLKIGSTQKGIGPCYADKASRIGLRVQDILKSDFKEQYANLAEKHSQNIPQGFKPPDETIQEWWDAINFIKNLHIEDTEEYLNKHLAKGKAVMAEGAQGTLLDLDFGSYPFVTSSNTLAANACLGLGVSPRYVQDIYGVFKAYMTRVGSGPFPTELTGEEGEQLQAIGNEFGATTGRVRRCGWLDLPALRYAIQLNGVNKLIVTKCDVLTELQDPKYSEGFYGEDGSLITYPEVLSRKNVIPDLVPFRSSINSSPLPDKTSNQSWDSFKREIEDKVNTAIHIISIGPNRDDYLAYSEN